MFDRILNTPPHNQHYPTEALLTCHKKSKLPLANKNESAHIARSKLTDGKQSASVKKTWAKKGYNFKSKACQQMNLMSNA